MLVTVPEQLFFCSIFKLKIGHNDSMPVHFCAQHHIFSNNTGENPDFLLHQNVFISLDQLKKYIDTKKTLRKC
jgi:hypothetical protein